MDTKELNESARKAFGSDINIMVARCTAWGNDDNCVIVQGKAHLACASGFARTVRKAALATETSAPFMGSPARTYSTVVWP